MPIDLSTLELGRLFTRPRLAKLWGYRGYQAIARGVFTPASGKHVVLCVTRQWTGNIDLLLRLSPGRVVLIDHKAGPHRQAQCEEKAAGYAGQLAAYQEALTAQGLEVAGTWNHFPLPSVMVHVHGLWG